jgi:class 3 adenylate cyclase
MQATSGSKQMAVFGTIVAAVVLFTVAAERLLPVVRIAENWSRDLRIATLTPPEPQSDRVVVVTVTEDTLAAFAYRSPLDRRFLADLLHTLEKKGAAFIGLDILLDQPSEADKDEHLVTALRGLSVPLVVAWADSSDGLGERQSKFMSSYLAGIRHGVPAVVPDPVDGTVRAVWLRQARGVQTRTGFVAVIADALGESVPDGESLTIRYRGRPDAETSPFAVYPAHAVTLLPDDWFEGRIVLVGADLDLADRHRTPFSVAATATGGDMPGVLLQAHALSQILDGRAGAARSVSLDFLMALLAAVVGIAIVYLSMPLVLKAVTLVIAAGAVWVAAFSLYQMGGPLLPVVIPSMALVLGAALTYVWRWREEQSYRRFIHNTFSRFVAPAVVDHMIAEPGRLRLGGERRETSFLFTDVAGYTTLTENTEPVLLVEIMNEYMDGACDIVLAHGGTIDKMVGDALHVMFNAPLEQPDHAERAVACALALDAFCQEFVAQQRDRGIEFGITRIGVNTGVTIVGNFGGKKYFDYTATGDAINATARLESVNKQLGTRMCVSGTTADLCPGTQFRPVGELVLMGKSESVTAYEPVANGVKEHTGLDEYMEAYRLLCDEDPRAEGAFRALAERYPQDALVRFHVTRLANGDTGVRVVMKEK